MIRQTNHWKKTISGSVVQLQYDVKWLSSSLQEENEVKENRDDLKYSCEGLNIFWTQK